MEKFISLEVVVNANGLVRLYGDGGMIFEVQSDYVQVKTFVDPQIAPPSGTVKKPNK